MKALVGAILLVAFGCSDGSGAGDGGVISGGGNQMFSCAAYLPGGDGGMGMLAVCLDATGATAQDVANNQQSCAQQGGVFSRELCTHEMSLGGCRETLAGNPATLTTWYYGDSDPSQIQQLCAGLASQNLPGITVTYVAP